LYSFSSIKAENLVEYQWPTDSSGEYYMLQEQLSTFLNITSFKRKYPGNSCCGLYFWMLPTWVLSHGVQKCKYILILCVWSIIPINLFWVLVWEKKFC